MPRIGLPELLILAVVVLPFVLQVWAIVDALRVPDDSHFRTGTKLIWVLVILLFPYVGALIYLVMGRPRRA
jgi:hypothetical protein